MTDVFDDIRRACGTVAERATFVRLVHERIPAYAASLAAHRVPVPKLDTEHHYVADDASTLAYFLILDAVNFGSGWSPLVRKRPGSSLYFSVAMALRDHFLNQGPISADQLAGATAEDCARIFDQDMRDDQIARLMELFARSWNQLGTLLGDRFAGDPERFVGAASGSAARLVAMLAEMGMYHDVANYHGLSVPLYKRAQITVADLALALGGRGLGAFADLDRLTIFADNLIPHVLRLDGVLRYDPALVNRIESGELILPGSPEEIEIRAVAVAATEVIVAELRAAGQMVAAKDLDHLLWHRGKDPVYKARLRHRCRSTAY